MNLEELCIKGSAIGNPEVLDKEFRPLADLEFLNRNFVQKEFCLTGHCQDRFNEKSKDHSSEELLGQLSLELKGLTS